MSNFISKNKVKNGQKKFMIENYNQFIAKTFLGLEEPLIDELKLLGAKDIVKVNRGVKFTGDKELLYKANLHLRTALRILVPFLQTNLKSPEELYEFALTYNWLNLLSVSDTFAIDAIVNSKYFTHSKYAALKLKDAIADYFRRETGVRPSVNTINPNYRINLHISEDRVTISLDSSGDSLHRRGYRKGRGPAPLNEVLAAGIIKLSGWSGDSDLFDPMCGSGTIAIEAALIAKNIPPGYIKNSFSFMKWYDYDEKLYKRILKRAEAKIDDTFVKIYANDISPEIIRKAKLNAVKAGVNSVIKFSKKDFFEMDPPLNSGFIISNPPYDERLRTSDINKFYKQIGDTLKHKYTGFEAWIFSGNLKALKSFGLKPSKKYILLNGAIDSRLNGYELYSGSKKQKENLS